MENIKNIYDGIISILHIKSFHFLILYSFLLWLLYLIVTIILVNSCEINLSLIDTSILFILGSLSIGIPALPGSIGTYDAAVKYTLVILFGIKSYQALNYAIISHAVSYFPLTIIGAIFFIYENISIKNMKKIGLKNETL